MLLQNLPRGQKAGAKPFRRVVKSPARAKQAKTAMSLKCLILLILQPFVV
jgi:hypothetical protein